MAKSLTFKFDSTVAGQNRANALLTALSGKPFTGCEPVNFEDGRGSKHVYAVLVNLDPVVYKHIVPANWLSYPAKTMAEVIEGVTHKKITDITSVREGEVVGFHKVTFDSGVDTVEITHNAKTRGMFAEGALLAAKFLVTKDKGSYNMDEVLGMDQ